MHGITFELLLKTVFLPTLPFQDLMLPTATEKLSPWMAPYNIHLLKGALFSLIMFGSMMGLVRRPGAFLAALVALFGFSMFFNLVYVSFYRHEALWLVS